MASKAIKAVIAARQNSLLLKRGYATASKSAFKSTPPPPPPKAVTAAALKDTPTTKKDDFLEDFGDTISISSSPKPQAQVPLTKPPQPFAPKSTPSPSSPPSPPPSSPASAPATPIGTASFSVPTTATTATTATTSTTKMPPLSTESATATGGRTGKKRPLAPLSSSTSSSSPSPSSSSSRSHSGGAEKERSPAQLLAQVQQLQQQNATLQSQLVYHSAVEAIYGDTGFNQLRNLISEFTEEEAVALKASGFESDSVVHHLEARQRDLCLQFTQSIGADLAKHISASIKKLKDQHRQSASAATATQQTLRNAGVPDIIITNTVASLQPHLDELQSKIVRWEKLKADVDLLVATHSSGGH